MKLDLKALRGNPGAVHPLAGTLALSDQDFSESVDVRSPLVVEGTTQFHRGEIIVLTVSLQIELDRPCSRCLKPVAEAMELSDSITLRGTDEEQMLPEDYAYLSKSDTVDLKPIFVNLIVDGFSLKPLCHADCKGLCPHCGVDLNNTSCMCSREQNRDPRLAGLSKLLDA